MSRGRASSRGTLDIEVLGVDVALECDDPACSELLELCYARMTRPSTATRDVLQASLTRAGAGWRVRVAGDEHTEPDPVAALRSLNHELIQAAMRRARALYYVHAAVVEWRGGALVLPGLSRAGKSTLALALLLEGARLLSDEILAWDSEARRLRPLPRAVKIRDECVAYFPELAHRFRGAGEGRFLPFDALAPDVLAAGSARIAAVVVPRWSSDGATRLAPITRGQALLALAESSLNFGAHRVQSIDRLSALVEGARTLRLDWHEPRGAARAVLQELRA